MMGFFRCASDVTACHRADTTPGGTIRARRSVCSAAGSSTLPSRTMWEDAAALFETLRQPGQAHILEVLPMGGAVDDLRRTDTAYVHRGSLFTVNFLVDIADAAAADSAGKSAGQQFVDNGFDTLRIVSLGARKRSGPSRRR